MSQNVSYEVTNVNIPGTDLPKIKLININNVMYRCERTDEEPKSLSNQEIEDLVRKALASDTDSKTINIINIQDKEVECPEARRQREELLKSLAQVPIQRPDSAHSFIESISEIKEIEEPAIIQQEYEPAKKEISGNQPNQIKQILRDLLDENKRIGEPKFVLTKVTKFITKRVHTEKKCVCK